MLAAAARVAAAQSVDAIDLKLRPKIARRQIERLGASDSLTVVLVSRSTSLDSLERRMRALRISLARLDGAQSLMVVTNASTLRSIIADTAVVRAYVPADAREIRVLRAVSDAVRVWPARTPINLSLDALRDPSAWEWDPDDPMTLAFATADAFGHVPVVAAGNEGTSNSLNTWCYSPFVLCVGAGSSSGEALAFFSSRGVPGDSVRRPSVVAHGVDVLTTHPTYLKKTAEQEAAEQRIGFDTLVAPEMRHAYTVVSGTSFAAPQVTRVVALLQHFYTSLERELSAQRADPDSLGFEVSYLRPHKPADPRVVGSARRVGSARWSGDTLKVTYPARYSAAVVIQIVHDLATPMPRYQVHEVGAGFVSYATAFSVFGQYGHPDIRLNPIKVIGDTADVRR